MTLRAPEDRNAILDRRLAWNDDAGSVVLLSVPKAVMPLVRLAMIFMAMLVVRAIFSAIMRAVRRWLPRLSRPRTVAELLHAIVPPAGSPLEEATPLGIARVLARQHVAE